MADNPKPGLFPARDFFVLFGGTMALAIVANLCKMPMWLGIAMIWVWVLGFPKSKPKPKPDEENHD